MRFEVLSQPTRKPFRIQFGIWQDISKTGGHSETISGNVNLSGGTGSVTVTSIGSPASWWQIRTDSPVDFTRPEDFYRIGIVLWKGNCVVKGQGWGTDGCPEYQAEFFPLQARIAVVAVAQGSTFSGWSNCNGGSTTPLLTISPASKTVSSASGSSTFTVSSNVNWTTSESSDWLSVTKANATTLTVNYNANASTSNRSAIITLSGSGVSNQTVTLNQEGCQVPDAPTVTASYGTYVDKVQVSWIVVEGATSYDVYREQTFLINTANETYLDSDAVTSATSSRVIAKNACGSSAEGTDEGYKSLPSSLDANQTTRNKTFTIFPNPSDGMITISAKNGTAVSDRINLIITDLSGTMVYNNSLQMGPDETVQLQLTLSPGIYLISIDHDSMVYREKLLIH
jgi:hypothetical protein